MSRFVILDRDGTIIRDKQYMHDVRDIEFLPNAIEGLLRLQDVGYQFIIITNQAGVARGYFTEVAAYAFHEEVVRQLAGRGVRILKSYFCMHHPKFTGDCICRKPKTTLAEQAAKECSINLREVVFVGDKDSDIEFGKNCGGKTVRIRNKQYPTVIKADSIVKDLSELFSILSS